MRHVQDDIAEKISIIQKCLAKSFVVLTPKQSGELWIFTTGAEHFEFGFFRPAMEALRLQQLQPFMETEVLPMMLQNPGKMIYFGIHGLSVRERNST